MISAPAGYSVGPGRYRIPARSTHKNLFVVHDSESSDTSFQSLLNFMATPATATNVASYHGLTNGLGDWMCLWNDCKIVAPFSAPPTNDYAFHVCIPGRADQTLQEWTDPISLNHIKGMARAIVELGVANGIPARYVTGAELKELALKYPDISTMPPVGYTSHNNVRIAWGKTTHTDPGPNFPWPILDQEIKKLLVPPTPPATPPANYLLEEFEVILGTYYFVGQSGIFTVDWVKGTYTYLPSWDAYQAGLKAGDFKPAAGAVPMQMNDIPYFTNTNDGVRVKDRPDYVP